MADKVSVTCEDCHWHGERDAGKLPRFCPKCGSAELFFLGRPGKKMEQI